MPLNIIVGAQWGDEGKGRVVDLLAGEADIVARYSGGDNAGHTVTVGEDIFKLHLLPSGIVHPHIVGLLGNGMVINPATLLEEIEQVREAGVSVNPDRVKISSAAHLITPGHRALDGARERARGDAKIGTTGRGIGPAYTSKVNRSGLRTELMLVDGALSQALADHLKEVNYQLEVVYREEPLDDQKIIRDFQGYAEQLRPYLSETGAYAEKALAEGKMILAEGAQGTLLDLDHGTYPYVTSSTPTAPGALVGLGLGIGSADRVIGVVKAFQTRVGEGPFPTELEGDLATRLRGTGQNQWDEFGTTTGRPRRVGWLDIVLLRYAIRVNGITEIALTKLDILSGFDQLKLCTAYQIGEEIHQRLPMGPGNLGGMRAIYEELPGWEEDLTSTRQWADFPEAARGYVKALESLLGVPVTIISVGPERSQVIQR
ncbi:MAG TPA: adenylosuccinate synthase [Chloroflexi bacterium]|nr:MAG: adenylosuccinate synthase [Chloroflexota bacterium]HDD56214.1 adenylosuccinate synthase [Chloroflexota bacterium]